MFTGIDSEGVLNTTPDRCPVTGVMCNRKSSIYKVDPQSIGNSYTQTFLVNRGTKFGIMSPLLDWNESVVGFVFLEYCHDGFLTEDELLNNTHLACRTTDRIYQLISNLDPTVIIDATKSNEMI
jgi:hypothetical protein